MRQPLFRADNENFRVLTKDDALNAAEAAGIRFPVSDSSDLINVATAVLEQPVSQAGIETALRTAYVTLPLKTPADLLEAYNRILDVNLGDPGEGEAE